MIASCKAVIVRKMMIYLSTIMIKVENGVATSASGYIERGMFGSKFETVSG